MSLLNTLILEMFILWSSPKFTSPIESVACLVIIAALSCLSVIVGQK